MGEGWGADRSGAVRGQGVGDEFVTAQPGGLVVHRGDDHELVRAGGGGEFGELLGAGDRSPLAAISLSGPADAMELPRLAATLRHTAATLRRGAPTLAEGVGRR